MLFICDIDRLFIRDWKNESKDFFREDLKLKSLIHNQVTCCRVQASFCNRVFKLYLMVYSREKLDDYIMLQLLR